ncbi:hypothetical protein ACFFX0_14195 [Citricoccus parietis]|uniref:Uncharacterized protein n=1 Tax=Citricoccus parietis TaxID=592307 RepID=A0ABV5G021_9MICC
MKFRSRAVMRARCPAALRLNLIFSERRSETASMVLVSSLIVVFCELLPPALTYSNL